MGKCRIVTLSPEVCYPARHLIESRLQPTHNIQIALTALSTYAKLSSERNRVFSRLAKNLVDLLPPALAATINTVSRKGKEREGETTLSIHRVQRLLLGERSITFQRDAVGLTVSWDIKVDSLGFAGSNLSIATKMPSNCMPSFGLFLMYRARSG
jgi:hypothetical protein